MELKYRNTTIRKELYRISSPIYNSEEYLVYYDFVKKILIGFAEQSMNLNSTKYDIIDFPFLYTERRLDSVILPILSSLCKGLVLTEYPVNRKKVNRRNEDEDNNISRGRIDYWCIYKDYSFVIELKHSYDCITTKKTRKEKLIDRWIYMNSEQLNTIKSDIKKYYCPIKILQNHKIMADFICEVSPFSLDFSRQTIKSNHGQKYTF